MTTNNTDKAPTPPGVEEYTKAEAERMGAFDEDAISLADAVAAATDDAARAREVGHGDH